MSERDDHVPGTDVEAGRGLRPQAHPSTSARAPHPGRVFPLNSSRLTSRYLVSIARALELPTKGTVEETRLIIEGKLTEMGREPRNVQVCVSEPDSGCEEVSLRDARGVFVDAQCRLPEASGVEESEEAVGTGLEHRDGDARERTSSGGTSVDAGEAADATELTELQARNEELVITNDQLTVTNNGLTVQVSELEREVSRLNEEWKRENERVNEMWRMNCAQLSGFDEAITAKDAEISRLQAKIAELGASRTAPLDAVLTPVITARISDVTPRVRDSGVTPSARASGVTLTPPRTSSGGSGVVPVVSAPTHARRGKAPPISEFTGEDPDCTLDDWLPSLERASTWNSWTDEEKLMQLAGHLRSRALQEWNLLLPADRASCSLAIEALRLRLDSGSKAVAAQDFRHTMQRDGESVADFIRRLERTFRVAYGREPMSSETRDMLLYAQLQEGLRLQLMKGPAVSGAKNYQELCIASKNEEKRLANLERRQEYAQTTRPGVQQNRQKQSFADQPQPKHKNPRFSANQSATSSTNQSDTSPSPPVEPRTDRKCYYCGRPGHLIHQCQLRKKKEVESRGPSHPASAKQVVTDTNAATEKVSNQPPQSNVSLGNAPASDSPGSDETQVSPLSLLLSDSDDDGDVKQVTITDSGSHSRLACVSVQGVPAKGIVDTAADITIMGGKLFALVASSARLRKRDFKPPDKIPRTYDRKAFHLDGRMEMEISFEGRTIKTTVYVKMDAPDELLLAEGVCSQLGIVSYHPSLLPQDTSRLKPEESALVPSVRVCLVQSLRLPPSTSAVVTVRTESKPLQPHQLVFVEGHRALEMETGVVVEDALLPAGEDGLTRLVVTNFSGLTRTFSSGTSIGTVEAVEMLSAEEQPQPTGVVDVRGLSSSQEDGRKRKLFEEVQFEDLPESEMTQLREFLAKNHMVFGLEEGERGETDIVTMTIDTGDAQPRKQAPRRMPFVVRQEVAKQLRGMQRDGVIQPSYSPWSSPVVMVRKRDGSHRFCVDYRGLNAVTKADTFPLPRIDDLLDQLGGARYFSTLDLASGFWQIRMDPNSREKTAFVTPHGLYEFLVMPFGLTNAPAVFQRLMQRVISGLNPDGGTAFVAAYLDDILIFSKTLPEHLDHLKTVISRLRSVDLKLKPSKCKFVCKEVEYLGHVITSSGLRPNARLTEAVRNFPRPENMGAVRRFLGLASYYRRFIQDFAKIACPLHGLTVKDAPFDWTPEREVAFTTLKAKLITSPVLAYPSFDKDFTLETDASIQGLGAVLSQKQEDSRLHPIAYASRALNPAEKNYCITELETLAVVWGISHFRSYLYGNAVTVWTDHSAVKSVLETSNPTGKHARWWTRVYGSGVRRVTIVYRAGRENACADALSRSPYGPAPVLGIAEGEFQVSSIASKDATSLLQTTPEATKNRQSDYSMEQRKDPELRAMIGFLGENKLPDDSSQAKKIAARESQFTLTDGVLYFIDHRYGNQRRVVVPRQLREKLLHEVHGGTYSGHFSARKVYNALVRHWWWSGMYADVLAFCKRCPNCAIVTGAGRQRRPPLRPIPVTRPFQKIGVDIMDLPCTERGNKHVVVFQDMLTKWPMVFPVPDQKTERIVRLLCEEIVPMFGVPEALLSDRGANLLSHLMLDVCNLLGIEKMNTTSYHPECDGMIERFNRTLKTMLRKRAAQYGVQWDNHLAALLWAYRNTPHDSTGEKPSFLLFGWDCRSPTEAALLPVDESVQYTTVADYREELVHSLSSARQLALKNIREAQRRYKAQYDRNADDYQYRVGDWVLIRFPSEETGRFRKLSRPWHGPYRVTSCNDTNVTAIKVYFPRESPIQVHQSRVKPCPDGFTAGYFWYGGKRKGPGRPPKWVEKVLSSDDPCTDADPAIDSLTDPLADVDPDSPGDFPAVPESMACDDDVPEAESVCPRGTDSLADLEAECSSPEEVQPDDQEYSGASVEGLTQSPGSRRYSLRTARRPPDRFV